jgi:hypothetical protein
LNSTAAASENASSQAAAETGITILHPVTLSSARRSTSRPKGLKALSSSDARHFPYYRSLRGFTKKRRVPIAILRGYKPADELASFEYALRNPKDHLKAASKSRWQHASNWTFPLSAAFWLLVLFRSSAVRSLREHDSPALHKLQQHIDQRDDLKGLRAVATEEMSWEDYQTGKVVPVRTIKALSP